MLTLAAGSPPQFYSVLCIVHIYVTLFYRLRDWGPSKFWGPLVVAQSVHP